MVHRLSLAALLVFGLAASAIAQVEKEAKEAPKLERLDGKVQGIIVGLQRATIAVISSRQITTYLHLPHSKLPDWLRVGLEITAFYRIGDDGSFWAEEIKPYTPPVIVTPQPNPNPPAAAPSTPPASSSSSSPSRYGTLMDMRQWQLGARGLSSALRRSFSPPSVSPIESEVQRLLPHYKAAAKFFNPNLTDEQAEVFAGAILRFSIRNGIDPRLVVAVIACESSFRPDAVGKKGEIGLGQLKPETAAGLGVDPYDPIQNIDGCVRYLRLQLDRFGSLELALAAYNAGPTAVSKAGGIPQNNITPRYVQKVLALYRKLCGQ